MNKTAAEPTGERLSKRVMALRQCSRSEAERFIAGGWVRVNGVVVEDPPHRVRDETVTIDPKASLLNLGEATFVLHKPEGCEDGTREVPPADGQPQSFRLHLLPILSPRIAASTARKILRPF